jgi:hypothetical protein
MVLNRCKDPNMINIIQNSGSPEQAFKTLCSKYPGIAQQIDTVIGQGQNPQQIVMNILNRK